MPLTATVLMPLLLLHLLIGGVSGLWLAGLGQWSCLGLGVGVFFFGPALIQYFLTPGTLVSTVVGHVLGIRRSQRLVRSKLALLISVPVIIALGFLITAWSLGAYHWCLSFRTLDQNPLPFLLWAYLAAVGPVLFVAFAEARTSNQRGTDMIAVFAMFANLLIFATEIQTPDDRSLIEVAPSVLGFLVLGFMLYTSRGRQQVLRSVRKSDAA